MGMLKDKWLGGSADVAIRATFSFAMCGTLAGLMYLTAQDGLADGSSAQQAMPRTATVLASIDTKPQADRLPATVDIPHASVTIQSDAPVTASTDIRPAIPTRRPVAPVRLPVEKNAVARFDSCLPGCETRDPMVIGYADKTPNIEPVLPQDDQEIEQPVSLPVLAGATALIGKALDAPGAAFRKGRSVITTVVRATL